jgi:hypothetical protein
MTRLLLIALIPTVSICRSADAVLEVSGIVQSATVTRSDLGGGFDSLVITFDVGANVFDSLDGGFMPLGLATFNQVGAPDAMPPGMPAANDTTFLLPPPSFDDNMFDEDSDVELSTTFLAFSPPLTGSITLARLVVPTGADAKVIGVPGGVDPTKISLVRNISPVESIVVGSISGDTTAIPETSQLAVGVVLCLGILGAGLIRRQLAGCQGTRADQ